MHDSDDLEAGIGSEFGLSELGGYRASHGASSCPESFKHLSFTANGRAALGLAATLVKKTSGRRRHSVLLPSYLCHSMIQPFAEHEFEYRFYAVQTDLSILPDEVCDRIDDTTVAVLVMHYFGFSQAEELTDVILRRFPELIVVDDRTHLLLSDLGTGRRVRDGSVAVYSIRKWGPFPDLGIVCFGESGDHKVRGSRCFEKGYDLSFGLWRLLGAVLRAAYFTWPVDPLRKLSLWPFKGADAILDKRVHIRRASPISRLLWRRWDWVAAWRARRENFQYLIENWPSTEMTPMFTKLTESTCPFAFPIRTNERERCRRYLVSKRIFTPVHWPKPPQISPDEFPAAAALADQELTIPIDQRYGQRHMDHILEAVCRA